MEKRTFLDKLLKILSLSRKFYEVKYNIINLIIYRKN